MIRKAAHSGLRAKIGAGLFRSASGRCATRSTGGLRRRVSAGIARPLGDRAWELVACRDPQCDPARCARRAQRGRAAADRSARPRRPRRSRGACGLIESRRFSPPRSRAPTVQARRRWRTQRGSLRTVKGILSQQLWVSMRTRSRSIRRSRRTWTPNSLDLVELIMELEDQFGVKISDEEAQKIGTVRARRSISCSRTSRRSHG